jgi:beta-glucosidase/6-phospho-beta-glucosidase/beta-galactosidase
MKETIFKSYLMGGFECSTHKNRRGRRLDLIAATGHDRFAGTDYQRLLEIGIETARDGVRWHRIEREPFRYDFSSLTDQVEAARETGIQIIWDLFHYGYPEDLDIFSAAFPERFTRFAAATVEFLKDNLGENLVLCPVNEISFFSWAGGEVGAFYPYAKKRGNQLKHQLVKAAIAGIKEIKAICPPARIVLTDPAIHVIAGGKTQSAKIAAEKYRQAQFHSFDMLAGKLRPELGGQPEYLDVLGLNYYFHNQWRYPSRRKIHLGHKDYRPLHEILREVYWRYGRPLFIAETGIEGEKRPEWFRYVCEQTKIALAEGVPVEGICLYPIVNHPGWEDNRHCHNGLWCYPDETGEREIYQPLADEIRYQNRIFEREKLFLQSEPSFPSIYPSNQNLAVG